MGSDLHVVEIVSVLRILTAELLFSDDLDEALCHLAETAADIITGPSSCGVTIVGPQGVTTAASSSELPELLSKVQHDTNNGPCVSAVSLREITVAQDLTREHRWPGWTAWAVDQGVRGVLAAPIDIDDHTIGALGLYASEPNRFGPDVELTAMLIAEHAGLLLAGVVDRGSRLKPHATDADAGQALDRTVNGAAQASRDLGYGEMVNRAVGIIMAQRGCSPGHGLDVMRQASATLRLPMTVVAERLVNVVTHRARSGRRIPRTRSSHRQ